MGAGLVVWAGWWVPPPCPIASSHIARGPWAGGENHGPGPLTSVWFRASGSAFLASWGCFLPPPWLVALVTSWLERERLMQGFQNQSREKPRWCHRATQVLTGDGAEPLSDALPGSPVCGQAPGLPSLVPSQLCPGEASEIRGDTSGLRKQRRHLRSGFSLGLLRRCHRLPVVGLDPVTKTIHRARRAFP